MAAYYNEWDKDTAQWLRELIKRGLIPDGYVDDRSIVDVHPDDLKEFTQCHFFAGIAGWPLALRMAGWPDSRPVWTGSPPCQPFSNAGKGLGADDPRHLAPAFARLVRECRPARLFGEQVSAAVKKDLWVDDLRTRLEAEGYAFGFSVLPAAGVGAPHKRERIYFGAGLLVYPDDERQPTASDSTRPADTVRSSSTPGGVADGSGFGPIWRWLSEHRAPQAIRGQATVGGESAFWAPRLRATGGVADANDERLERWVGMLQRPDELIAGTCGVAGGPAYSHNSFWDSADWLGCRDGKLRPVRPGSFPLAHGIPGRVVRLRAYGNAIVPPLAAEFILSFEEAIEDLIGSGRADLDELI
ncbi:DNA methyltransferase [Klebsiella phage YMC16/01/N133_KPN_BP]|uniref:Putative methyltransferase n=1 Tax=Klebsiella phage YMC16/01/N133_KPN_BP TaxID=2026102 RepID=A0A248XD49_9CAUD|nr:DNA methyltransferase [Klebsiella phage YMC16/01/N133_KPN_BP]ASW27629.1 putative methyltransferase [Klebsiella phage YMC16/01/N133_KPN_BP]